MASVAKSAPLFQLGLDRLGLVFGRHQNVAGVNFLFGRHLLDGVVIDFVHRVVGLRSLPGVLQQRLHQHFVALEFDAVPDVVAVGKLLLFGGLRQHHDVGEIGDEVLALLIRRQLRHVAADFFRGHGKVALADIDAIGAGDHRIGIVILRLILGERNACRQGEQGGKRQRADCAGDGRTNGGHKRGPLARR